MRSARVRAATLVAPGRYEIREYPLPDPAPGCVLVKMRLSGICGTDKHTYQGYTTQYAGTGAPREIPFPILGEVPINPHRHLCSKNVRIIGVGGEEAAAYGPSMRQLARYMRRYPVREFVSHRYRLADADAAVQKSVVPDSMKVVIDPWA